MADGQQDPASPVALAETDVPNYRRGSDDGDRCIGCAYSTHVYRSGTETLPSREGYGCRLYDFDNLGGAYKPWFVCDSFKACDPPSMLYADEPVKFAQVGDKEADGSVWIELIRTGSHHSGHKGGTAASGQESIDIDAAFIASIHRGAAAILADGRYPSGIPVRLDPDHSNESGPAVGRIKETRVDASGDVTRLLGRVLWTEAGAATVMAGEYDSVSIEAEPPGSMQDKRTGDEISDWALTGVVVTNHPFIAGMEPLAASEQRSAGRESEDMEKITQALSLAEDAGESVVLAEIERLRTEAGKVAVLETTLTDVQASLTEVKEKLSAADERETDRLLDTYCSDGRFEASKRDDVKMALSTMGREWVERNFPADSVKTVPRGESGGDAASAPIVNNTAQDAFEATCSALMADGKSAAEAYHLAMDQHGPALAAAYRAERGDN